MINYLKNSTLIKSILTLVTGVALGQIVLFVTQIFIRRYYSVSDFGAFDIYVSSMSIIMAFISFRYEYAIVTVKYDKAALNALILSLVPTVFFSLVLFIIVFLFRQPFINLIGFPHKYSFWIIIMPFSVLLGQIFYVFSFWFIRQAKYKFLSFNKVIRRITEGGMQISFGKMGYSFGLVFGDLIGNFTNFLYGIFIMRKTNINIHDINYKTIKYVLIKFKDLPLIALLPNFLNTLCYTVPIFVLNKLQGNEAVGYLNLSRQVLLLPSALLAASISQVLVQKVSIYKTEKRNVINELQKVFKPLFLISILQAMVIWLFGIDLFSFVFGEKWNLSGQISKILVLGFSLQLIISPFTILFTVFDRIKMQAIWQVSYFVGISSLFLFKNLNLAQFAYLYLIIDLLFYSIYGYLLYRVINQYENSLNNVEQ